MYYVNSELNTLVQSNNDATRFTYPDAVAVLATVEDRENWLICLDLTVESDGLI